MTTKWLSLDQDFCIQKLESAISLAETLCDGDYPHDDPKDALRSINEVYKKELGIIKGIEATDSSETIGEYCRRANIAICLLKPFVGLILRSSNLRNAFEMYFPIKELAWSLLKNRPKVILGSEWSFSPFTYPIALKDLPAFVFIGVPASECQNPLIIPLAAHELGHVIWNRNGAKQDVEDQVKNGILSYYQKNWGEFNESQKKKYDVDTLQTDMFVRKVWRTSYSLCLRQIEEVFCDYIALFVYGKAFLYSFQYLVAPSLGRQRSLKYPRISDRAFYLSEAAKEMRFSVPPNFSSLFSEDEASLSAADYFVQKASDSTTKALAPELITLVKKYRGKCKLYKENNEREKNAEWCMREMVPPLKSTPIEAIVNGAWNIRIDIDEWHILDHIKDNDERRVEKLRLLNDVTLKGYEVFEYQSRISKHKLGG